MQCATHPDVETNLRCGKCGKAICPKCMAQTPVGARCPDCAKQYKLPTYSVSSGYYLRAAGAALGMAVVCGLAWGIIANLIMGFIPIILSFVIAGIVGWGIGEVVGLAVNRKRGRGLAVIGGAAVVLAYVINVLVFGGLPLFGLGMLFEVLAVIVGVYTAVSRLK
jgi:hypothetical protein